MKARIKATGEEVEVFINLLESGQYVYVCDDRRAIYAPGQLEIIKTSKNEYE